jgi:hypothetical protein
VGTVDTGLSLKEQVKRGDISAGEALDQLTRLGDRESKTYRWLSRRVGWLTHRGTVVGRVTCNRPLVTLFDKETGG